MTTYTFTWRFTLDGDFYEMSFAGFANCDTALAAWSETWDAEPSDCALFTALASEA